MGLCLIQVNLIFVSLFLSILSNIIFNIMFIQFVLVDDAGLKLAEGTPTGTLPDMGERRRNYQVDYYDILYCTVMYDTVL